MKMLPSTNHSPKLISTWDKVRLPGGRFHEITVLVERKEEHEERFPNGVTRADSYRSP